MKKIINHLIGAALLGLAASGCTSGFETFNKNPYEPSHLPVASFFPGMLDCLAAPQQNDCQFLNTMYSCYGGHVTAPASWTKGIKVFATFNVDDDWNQSIVNTYFTKFYPSFFNVQKQTGSAGYTYAMAQLLRVYIMQMVASIQGPLPYTKVENGQYTVPYDNEETAWKAMFDELDEATRILRQAAEQGLTDLAAVDRVYSGDIAKWIRFANTLKLRMAIRISGKVPAYAQQKAEEAVKAGVMESVDDSAYDLLNGRQPNGYNIVASWGEVKANATLVSYMNGYNDPRRAKYFTKQTAVTGADAPEYLGVRSGIANCVPATYKAYSGLIYEALPNTTKMPIMYAAEAYFLRAEGALKGWAMNGTAKDLYEAGIRCSMNEWGVSDANTVDAYVANSSRKPGAHTDARNGYNHAAPSDITIAWGSVSDDEKHLEQIITQKWIANFTISLEGWCDFRRTGYPYIFEPVDNLSSWGCTDERQVRRLRFPLSEYNTNRSNTEAAVQMLSTATDSENVDLWWAKKSNGSY